MTRPPGRPEVWFQIFMGAAKPWTSRRCGTVADLYASFFDIARTYIPPFAVLNDKLAKGIDRAGEHGIHLRWSPLRIDEAEYVRFCEDLRSSPERAYQQVAEPPEIRTWDAWSWWIYQTQIEPNLAKHPGGSPSRDEIALRRRYRKALASGDASAAAALAAEIRERLDPSFS